MKVFEQFGDIVVCIEVVYGKYGVQDTATHFYKDGKKVYALYHELPLEYVYVDNIKSELMMISPLATKRVYAILKRFDNADWEKIENLIKKTNSEVIQKIMEPH